ncbi:endonuclease [Mycoplasma hafezii]|uniref:endonuclease n=1 Tax=Mycoplasma hafezii TaxID=525886 RepID=UPI003CF8922E
MDYAVLYNHVTHPDKKYGLQFFYDWKTNKMGARAPKSKDLTEGINFKPVDSKFGTVIPALADDKKYIDKKGFANTNLSADFDAKTGKVTIHYFLVSRNEQNKPSKENGYVGPLTASFVIPAEYLKPETNDTKPVDNPKTDDKQEQPKPITPVVAEGKFAYDASNNYYKSLDGLSGKELMDALVKLQVSKHETGNYNNLPSFYNSTNAFKDRFFENDGTMLDVYSENPNGKDPYTFNSYATTGGANEGDGMNREHVIPQSWFRKVAEMRNDPIHVWPTDIKVNRDRSNYPHDNVVSSVLTSENGSRLGTNSIGEKTFEPVDAFKGDIARAYLYFAMTYGSSNNITETKEAQEVFQKSAPYLKPHYLETYLNWNKQDPVDAFDVVRNNETANWTEQHRRNPFIDYPDLADSLFGNKPFVNKGVLVLK